MAAAQCPVPYTGVDCDITFASALGDSYVVGQAVFCAVVALCVLCSSWRYYLMVQAQGFALKGILDIQKIFHYSALWISLWLLVHCIDPNNWNATFNKQLFNLSYEFCTLTVFISVIVLVAFWQANASHRRAMSLPNAQKGFTITACSLISAYAIALCAVQAETGDGKLRSIKMFGYLLVSVVILTLTTIHGFSMRKSLVSAAASKTATPDVVVMTRIAIRKLTVFLATILFIGLAAIAAQIYVTYWGFQQNDDDEEAPTKFLISPFDPIFVCAVFTKLFFFRKIHKDGQKEGGKQRLLAANREGSSSARLGAPTQSESV